MTSGEDLVSVRLAGVRGPRPLTPHTWVGDGARPPGGSAHVSLGRLGDSTLSVDLALAPDVITVTGPARRHLALALARQLGATGLPVTIVGNPLETEPPTGCATARTLDEVPATPASVGIVLYGPSGDDDQPAIRRLAARSAPRMVIVIVGDVPRARWSIEVRPQTTP